MFGYRKIDGYLLTRTINGMVLQRIVALAYRKNIGDKREFSNKDLVKLQKLAEAFADSKYFSLEFNDKGETCWVKYFINDECINLEREIEFFEKTLRTA